MSAFGDIVGNQMHSYGFAEFIRYNRVCLFYPSDPAIFTDQSYIDRFLTLFFLEINRFLEELPVLRVYHLQPEVRVIIELFLLIAGYA